MTEEPLPDELVAFLKRIGTEHAHQLNRTVTAILVEAVDQVRKSPETWQHEEVTLSMKDLTEEALSIPHFTPEIVVFATARASAALIVGLCNTIGMDPAKLLKSFEEQYFRQSL